MKIKLALANRETLAAIGCARYEVYVTELGQYEARDGRSLTDAGDVESTYIVATVDGKMVGFVGITPPTSARFSLEKHLHRDAIPFPFDEHLFEVRTLTVLRPFRGSSIASALMYAAFRWVESHGGTRIVSIGRREVLDMYLEVGLEKVGLSCASGSVTYELLSGKVEHIREQLKRFEVRLRQMEETLDWQVGVSFYPPSECYHGGAFFDAIGNEFDDLGRTKTIINADVLDAWFPPSPRVMQGLREQLDWAARTSPPTHAEGLVRTIARVRGVDPSCVLAAGGSSALIFLALRQWLRPSSRVLLLDPTYGEYAHVLENVIRCKVERVTLQRKDGYRIDVAQLARELANEYDLFIWVNPNNPTGQHVPRAVVEELLQCTPRNTRIWLDETYIDYVGPNESIELMASASDNVVVCKSLSKAYALSGLRVGYLCGPPHIVEELRVLAPPWSVGLPSQIAATYALQDGAYYAARHSETRELRRQLAADLKNIGVAEIIPSVANFLMFHLPDAGVDTRTVVRTCRRQGLFLRDISNMGSSLGNHAVRIAVKDWATNQHMISILRGAIQGID